MAAHAVHSLPPKLRSRQKRVREKLAAARKKYPNGIPASVRKAIFKNPDAVELAAGMNPEPFSTSKTSNWVARVGGLPTLIQHVAHDLLQSGSAHSTSDAIQKAVGIVRNWSHGHDGKGHKVKPETVAEAVKAIAEWDAKRARAKASPNLSVRQRRVIELAFERIERGAIELATPPPSPRRRLVNLVRRAIFADHLLEFAPSTAERKQAESKGQAMQGGRFPIRNRDDLQKAIRAVGRARPNTEEERRKVRRFIRRRAQTLGAMDLIPSSWAADGSLK